MRAAQPSSPAGKAIKNVLAPRAGKTAPTQPTAKPTVKGPAAAEKRKMTAPQPTIKSAKNTITSRGLKLVAEEVGIDESELTPGIAFGDIGLDSLLSLNLVGRLREELDLEVEASLFADYPTVNDLTRFLSAHEDGSDDS